MFRPIRMIAMALAVATGLSVRAEEAPIVGAFGAARGGDWATAYALVGNDALARDLLTWTRLREVGGTFGEYLDFLTRNADWPGLDRLRTKGEDTIPDSARASDLRAYFGSAGPQTGAGVLRFVTALKRAGEGAAAAEALRAAWTGLTLSAEEETRLIDAFGPDLAPLHAARAEAMLWRGRTGEAERLLPRLASDERAVVAARIALLRNADDVVARVNAVPPSRREDPGLAFDRTARFARLGDRDSAAALMGIWSTGTRGLGDPQNWARWRDDLARTDLRKGNAARAYDIASRHYLDPGDSQYPDMEWLAGYVALKGLNDPARAATHFANAESAAQDPITAARAAYWVGRAAEARGDGATAQAAYARAATHQTSYYGLLASEKLGLPLDPALARPNPVPPFSQAEFLNSGQPRAALMLVLSGERSNAVVFFLKLGRTLNRDELIQIGAILEALHEPYLALIMAKEAQARGIDLPEFLFPLHDLSHLDMGVTSELALAIARRESQFNPAAGSSAGAQGLMQLMPTTAEEIARRMGVGYDKGRLTSDWRYNAMLAGDFLGDLRDRYGDSPVLIASGYNAGPRRPQDWIALLGDPRAAGTDIVDWVEAIPYRETRVYVMRVTEAVPIYAARLGEMGDAIRFTAMLKGEQVYDTSARGAEGPVAVQQRRPPVRPRR